MPIPICCGARWVEDQTLQDFYSHRTTQKDAGNNWC